MGTLLVEHCGFLLGDLDELFGGFLDAVFKLLDVDQCFPLFHTGLPAQSLGSDLIGPEQHIQIPNGKRPTGLPIHMYIPRLRINILRHFFIREHLL